MSRSRMKAAAAPSPDSATTTASGRVSCITSSEGVSSTMASTESTVSAASPTVYHAVSSSIENSSGTSSSMNACGITAGFGSENTSITPTAICPYVTSHAPNCGQRERLAVYAAASISRTSHW